MTSSLLPYYRHPSQIRCTLRFTHCNLFRTVSCPQWPRTLSHSCRDGSFLKANSSRKSAVTRRFESKNLGVRCTGQRDGGISTEEAVKFLEANEKEGILPPGWPSVGLVLFGLGFLLGPALDGIHSRVQLQIYDNGAIDILGLKTNIWVPPLLGVFYSVAGLLQLALDRWRSSKDTVPQADTQKVAASFLTLALLLALSAEMYKAEVPYNIEAYVLFGLAELNWFLLDNTWKGFALACVVAVGCPLAEIPILKLFGLWHYPKANLEIFGEGMKAFSTKQSDIHSVSSMLFFQGVVTWVVCCYFFYTPFISNLARWLSVTLKNNRPN